MNSVDMLQRHWAEGRNSHHGPVETNSSHFWTSFFLCRVAQTKSQCEVHATDQIGPPSFTARRLRPGSAPYKDKPNTFHGNHRSKGRSPQISFQYDIMKGKDYILNQSFTVKRKGVTHCFSTCSHVFFAEGTRL